MVAFYYKVSAAALQGALKNFSLFFRIFLKKGVDILYFSWYIIKALKRAYNLRT
jgi:hypothetical protein